MSSIHRYEIGQSVRLKSMMGMAARPAEAYRITGRLPVRENSPQYRMRNDAERHERVAMEDSLEAIDIPSESEAALADPKEVL